MLYAVIVWMLMATIATAATRSFWLFTGRFTTNRLIRSVATILFLGAVLWALWFGLLWFSFNFLNGSPPNQR
jgi:hypothetical protein